MRFFRRLIKKWFLRLEPVFLRLQNWIRDGVPPPPPRKKIAGVPYEILYHGRLMAEPYVNTDSLGRSEIALMVIHGDGSMSVISIDDRNCRCGNLSRKFVVDEPLYEARFDEKDSWFPYRIFFSTEPTPEQILPFIPESMRKNDDIVPEKTGASPKTEVTS